MMRLCLCEELWVEMERNLKKIQDCPIFAATIIITCADDRRTVMLFGFAGKKIALISITD